MTVLVRYAEIGIKGKNRERFERALADNIGLCLRKHGVPFARVRRIYGRIIIDTEEDCGRLAHVFGIASFSQAVRAGNTIDELAAAAKHLVSNLYDKDTFRVSCQRLDKTFPLTSRDVCVQLGEKLRAMTRAKVRMASPTVDVEVEVIEGFFYLAVSRTEGPGGMPVGSQGKVIVVIEDSASVLAGILMLKRGCFVIPAVLNETDLSLLKAFACGHDVVPETVSSLEAVGELAKKQNVNAVVLNDSFDSIRQVSLNVLALRPLSGLNKEEIKIELQHLSYANAA